MTTFLSDDFGLLVLRLALALALALGLAVGVRRPFVLLIVFFLNGTKLSVFWNNNLHPG